MSACTFIGGATGVLTLELHSASAFEMLSIETKTLQSFEGVCLMHNQFVQTFSVFESALSFGR